MSNCNLSDVMLSAGPLMGVSGGVAALVAIPNPEAKLFACAAMFAVAAGSALRKLMFAAPVRSEPGEYPFDSSVAKPWERDGGPAGL